MRKHTNERPYKCELCSFAFMDAHSLKKHTFLHTGERPFKCDLCNKVRNFFVRYHLNDFPNNLCVQNW